MHDRARRIERRRGAVVLCFFTTIISVFGWLSSGAWAFSVTLAWDPNSESDLAGYTIYYDTDSGPPYRYSINVPLSSPDFNRYSPEYTVSGLADGTYYFVATAYNTDGLESGYSNEVYTPGSSTSPTPPPTNGAPTLSSLEVNGTSGSTTIYTNDSNRRVDIRIVASDDSLVSQYLVLDGNSNPNGGTFMAIPGGPRRNPIFTVSDFVLSNSDGNHTIYAWVKDDQGLASSTATRMNVILDRVAPTVAVSYSATNPFNAGDVVTITANVTDSSPISGIPKISINYAGTGNDISNASMTQVSNKQWRYVVTVPSGNGGAATVTIAAADAAGNSVGGITGGTFVVDNAGPTVVGFPVINYTENSITITYSENNMQNASLASSYSFNNGLLLSGNGVDTSGTGNVFKLPLNPTTLQRYLIYTLQIGSAVKDASGNAVSSSAIRINDDDNDGMADDWEKKWFGSITAKTGTVDSDGDGLFDSSEYTYARSNPAWGTNRWALSPLSQDSDGDGISDKYEVSFGLNPVSSSDRDLDLDGDGWSNYREYLYGFSANDPNSHPQASISPALGTLMPSLVASGVNEAQYFSAVYSDGDGFKDLKHVYLKVGSLTDGIVAIYFSWVNKLYMVDDAGTGYVGNCTPGEAKTLTNTQGTLDCGLTTVSGTGNDLTVNWNITPKSSFAGTKSLYMFARDNADSTAGWDDKGDWTITSPSAVAPTLGAITPSVVIGAENVAQDFSAVYSDENGYRDLKHVYLKVESLVNGIVAIYSRTTNHLYLVNDAGKEYVGNCMPGEAKTLTNTQGTLDCETTTVSGTGNNLTMNWNITAKAGFAGTKSLYMFARDNADSTAGWEEKGRWMIIP